MWKGRKSQTWEISIDHNCKDLCGLLLALEIFNSETKGLGAGLHNFQGGLYQRQGTQLPFFLNG